jgi:hypothetical protein
VGADGAGLGDGVVGAGVVPARGNGVPGRGGMEGGRVMEKSLSNRHFEQFPNMRMQQFSFSSEILFEYGLICDKAALALGISVALSRNHL